MNIVKRTLLSLAVAAALGASAAQAQISDNVVKIGVLSDMSSLYTDLAGAGSVAAARMAVEDSGIEKRGVKVEIVSADHQNKPDVGSAIARQWYDTAKVDVIVDVPNSGVALAVNQITRDKGKAFLLSGAASSDLTGLAGMLVFLTDIHSLGLPTAQGLIFTETFYWDMNDQTRAFAKRFAAVDKGIHPTMVHAGVYSAVTHYLKAVEALKSDDGTKVIAKMKETPTDDPLFGKGTIRADGRKIHPAYLVEVKKPSESKGPWDYYKVRATIPADQAFRPLNQGECPLVK